MSPTLSHCTAFLGLNRLATGARADVALAVKSALARRPQEAVLIFDDATGQQLDFDLRGDEADVRERFAASSVDEETPRAPGRPRLGVVAREVTLLPRHWEWLNGQPGGASAALRRMVDAARGATAGADRTRLARQSADRFMAAMAGDRPGYEEASRALYAGDRERFAAETAAWPSDVRDHALRLAEAGFKTAVEANASAG